MNPSVGPPRAHPIYGLETDFVRDISDWPERWLVRSGYDVDDKRALGATHTIAEVVRRGESGRYRVEGRFTRHDFESVAPDATDSARDLAIADLVDGSDRIRVSWTWNPKVFGLQVGEIYEFEIEVGDGDAVRGFPTVLRRDDLDSDGYREAVDADATLRPAASLIAARNLTANP